MATAKNKMMTEYETDPYDEVIFGRRRPDSVAIEWTSKTVYVLEFKRTSDQRHNYREHGERRARAQHDVLVKSLDTVAKEAKGENAGWTIKLSKNSAAQVVAAGLLQFSAS